MTDSEPALQILPTPKKRASYRPAALRTNSYTRLAQAAHSSPTTPSTPARSSSMALSRLDSRSSRASNYSPGGVTRVHWQPDSSAASCAACPTPFTFIERKHHCRRCGYIFCSKHSNYTVMLDFNAEFSPAGQSSRACPRCRRDFELWMSPADVQRPTEVAGGVRPQRVSRAQVSRTASGSAVPDEDEMRALSAASVPSDWTWSTF